MLEIKKMKIWKKIFCHFCPPRGPPPRGARSSGLGTNFKNPFYGFPLCGKMVVHAKFH